MGKYVPDLIQKLYANEEYRGKTVLLHNIKYDSEDKIVSYDVYGVYDGVDVKSTRDWAKLADKYEYIEDINRYVILTCVPEDLDAVEFL